MNYRIGRSNNRDVRLAVQEAAEGLQDPKLILFYSGVSQFAEYAKELKRKYPKAITMGATTFAAFGKEGAFKETLMLIGFEDGIRCEAGLLLQADRCPLRYVHKVRTCAESFKKPKQTICFEMTSALIQAEELVLSTLNSVLGPKKIPIFGGSAGDRGKAERTYIAYDGNVYQDACAFVLIENLGGEIHLYRENIYEPTEHQFQATKVDVRKRVVYELNHKPAAKVMADALNTSVANLGSYLDSYPLGRVIGDEMYIVANQAVEPNNAMSHHARIYMNSKLVLLKPSAYKEVISNTLEQVKKDCKKPALTLMVNCLARSLLFEGDGYLDEFATTVGSSIGDYIGFAGYGEQLNEQHFNQTMILAVFE